MSFLIDISTPPTYGPGTLPLVVIDFLPTADATRWRLWRAEFGVFTGNLGVVYVLRCDLDGSVALEDALAAEQAWGTEDLDFPVGSSRPSRQCEVDALDADADDETYASDGDRWFDLTYAALREAREEELDYEASLALALAILRRGIEDSDDGFIEIERRVGPFGIERDRVRVGPFEIALPPGVREAHVSFDFDARHRYAEECGWGTLVPFLIAAGIELDRAGDYAEGTYRRIFTLADERSCSGPALTEK
jgi:hypothetical protein